MEKTIKIGSKKIVIKASAAVLIYYKEQFGTEYNEDQEKLKETQDEQFAVLMGGQLIWAMAKAANDNILSPEEFYEDIGSFDLDLAMIEATELFEKSCQGILDSGTGDKTPMTCEGLISSALLCKMTVSDLNKMSLAMVINVVNEYCAIKSGETGYRQATQEDFDNL